MQLEPGTVLTVEGAAAEHVFPVVAGYLKESRSLPDGRAVTVRLITPGDLVGTESLARSEYASTVEAVTRARVCRVPRSQVEAVLRESFDQMQAYHRLLEMQVQAMRDQLVLTNGMSAEERVLEALRHLGRAYAPGAWFRPALSRSELGEYLDLALATVSRAVRRLEARGLIELEGRSVRIAEPSSKRLGI